METTNTILGFFWFCFCFSLKLEKYQRNENVTGGKPGFKKEALFSLFKRGHCGTYVYMLIGNINYAPYWIILSGSSLSRKENKTVSGIEGKCTSWVLRVTQMCLHYRVNLPAVVA